MTNIPRIILAALRGGSGKTIISLGLCRYFQQNGLAVHPFKKGPDYIDAAWMSLAAGRRASNLDPFLMPARQMESLFWQKAEGAELSIIEGNRGLFDGKDVAGSCSTAELARVLQTPVVLIIDCTKMTRTVAAVLQGCVRFEPGIHLAGVIFNHTAGERHRNILTRSVQEYTDVPVIGALPKLRENPIPERHMGLISDQEHASEQTLTTLAGIMGEWLDTDRILTIAREAPSVNPARRIPWPECTSEGQKIRIGFVRDAALWFYYEENIEFLRRAGAEMVEVSLLADRDWPDIDGLYLGGGFPEVLASELSANQKIVSRIRNLAAQGLPIYAECGGLMYLGESIICQDREYPMAGLFRFKTQLCSKPQGHGYTQVQVTRPNPFHPVGAVFPGHEFHYSRFLPRGEPFQFALKMERGKGIQEGCDGLVSGNVFATYTHIHAMGVPKWAERFVEAARAFSQSKR